MSGEARRFQFTIKRLALAVFFAAIAASILTIVPDENRALYLLLRGLVSFMAGGAAIGVLFSRPLYGAFVGGIVAAFALLGLLLWSLTQPI